MEAEDGGVETAWSDFAAFALAREEAGPAFTRTFAALAGRVAGFAAGLAVEVGGAFTGRFCPRPAAVAFLFPLPALPGGAEALGDTRVVAVVFLAAVAFAPEGFPRDGLVGFLGDFIGPGEDGSEGILQPVNLRTAPHEAQRKVRTEAVRRAAWRG